MPGEAGMYILAVIDLHESRSSFGDLLQMRQDANLLGLVGSADAGFLPPAVSFEF